MDINEVPWRRLCALVFFACVMRWPSTTCAPVRADRTGRQRYILPISDEAKNYAAKYLKARGYLDSTERLHSFRLVNALREFQKDRGLTPNGEFDMRTQAEMHEFRCGAADSELSNLLTDEDEELLETDDGLDGRRIHRRNKRQSRRQLQQIYRQQLQARRRRQREQARRRSRERQATTTRAPTRRIVENYSVEYLARWWFNCDLKWKVVNDSPKRNPAEVRNITATVLNRWADAGNLGTPVIQFNETQSQDADLRVSFVGRRHFDGNDFDGPGGILAHAFLPLVSGPYIGDLHLDEDEDWSPDSLAGKLMYYITLHEMGHALGLQHSMEFDAVMYPFIGSRHIERTELKQDDINKFRETYPKRWCDHLDEVPTQAKFKRRR
ncbi:PREDICTED: matrix metalloproteinase-18-like [Priapulus caudatus]|uniref:Matrix metalloproteinase-18-like n=1 Tax=Priapulus caudatus TaxID=37621 RepID=A0ABM1EKL7_PRICU|nr:PREDICTED: matrix metalloproteinase-18-like [Priapulus caudatus]